MMLKKLFVALLISSVPVSAVVAKTDSPETETADPRKFTSDRVFDLEYADSPRVSPDGRTVLYLRKSMDKFQDKVVGRLWSYDVRSKRHRPMFDGDSSISSVQWSPSGDRILYTTSNEGKPSLRVRYMDSGDSFQLAQFEHGPRNPVWSPNGKLIAFSMFVPSEKASFASAPKTPKDAEWSEPAKVIDDLVFRFDGAGELDKGASQIFVISADGGTARQITESKNGLSSPVWLDNETLVVDGNEMTFPELDPVESEVYKVAISDQTITALTDRDGPDHSPAVSPNGKLIAYRGYDDQLKAYQQTDLYVMNADGSNKRNLTSDYDRNIDNISWTSDNTLLAQVNVDGETHLLSINLSGKVSTLATDVGGTSIGRPYASGSYDEAKGTIAYTQASTKRPAELALRSGGKTTTVTDLNSDVLAHLDIAPIEEFTVKSSHDAREIEAWVALPKGFKADGSFPLILEIHGGPFAMYGPFFAAEIQRYAAEGYVTVYVNPRGSTSYGEEFAQLIDKAYPSFDHDDLMSVVDDLVARKYADPERLFITGGSGGGVLTAWAVGKTDRFAAAATIKPVINWATMALAADISAYVARHWMGMMPWEDPDFYWKQSPISLVGNVTTPTMVMVGEQDWRTPTWEAEQFYTALKLQKVDSVLVRIPGASHSIASRPSRLIAKVDNILGWFAKYDPANKDNAELEAKGE